MHQRLGLLRPVRRGGNGQPSGGCWHTLGALRHRRPALWLATTSGFWLSFAVNFAANKYVAFAARTNGRRQLVRYSVLVVPGHQVGARRLIGGRPPRALWRRRVL